MGPWAPPLYDTRCEMHKDIYLETDQASLFIVVPTMSECSVPGFLTSQAPGNTSSPSPSVVVMQTAGDRKSKSRARTTDGLPEVHYTTIHNNSKETGRRYNKQIKKKTGAKRTKRTPKRTNEQTNEGERTKSNDEPTINTTTTTRNNDKTTRDSKETRRHTPGGGCCKAGAEGKLAQPSGTHCATQSARFTAM